LTAAQNDFSEIEISFLKFLIIVSLLFAILLVSSSAKASLSIFIHFCSNLLDT